MIRPGDPFDPESRSLLSLTLVKGLGPQKIKTLTSVFGSAENVLAQPSHRLTSVDGIGQHLASQIGLDRSLEVDRQISRARRVNASLVKWGDRAYPHLLNHVYDPPPCIWIRGNPLFNTDKLIAVVGTRRPTAYGESTCRKITADLCKVGFTIVSGLAYGIDAIAHKSALDYGGVTVAVLGSGIDRVYPSLHQRLFKRICQDGCAISSFPLGTSPDGPNFPRRNRIISGICRATLVVEANETGGALITASSALEQNREVFAIPGPVSSHASRGTNGLIKNGAAKLVETVEDILEELDPGFSRTDAVLFEETQLTNSSLTEVERQIMSILDLSPMHVDIICQKTSIAPERAHTILLEMELRGLIRQERGAGFVKA